MDQFFLKWIVENNFETTKIFSIDCSMKTIKINIEMDIRQFRTKQCFLRVTVNSNFFPGSQNYPNRFEYALQILNAILKLKRVKSNIYVCHFDIIKTMAHFVFEIIFSDNLLIRIDVCSQSK